MISENNLLTAAEVADQMRVHVYSVYKWANSGELVGNRAGRGWRFKPEDVQAFLSRKQHTH